MKGYTNENGIDRPPCGMCRHKDKLTVEAPCMKHIKTKWAVWQKW